MSSYMRGWDASNVILHEELGLEIGNILLHRGCGDAALLTTVWISLDVFNINLWSPFSPNILLSIVEVGAKRFLHCFKIIPSEDFKLECLRLCCMFKVI